jgi:hypothetical protein
MHADTWMLTKHQDLFSKHKEINFDSFITVSLSVDFISSTGKLCSSKSVSLVGSLSKLFKMFSQRLLWASQDVREFWFELVKVVK